MMNKKTFVIGDIHGAFKALLELLDLIPYDPYVDDLVFVGDYVDGWPESWEVCQHINFLKQKVENMDGEGVVHTLLGNHDDWILDVLNAVTEEEFEDLNLIRNRYGHWINQGGMATWKSFVGKSWEDVIQLRDQFFRRLDWYHHDKKLNNLYVHAGWNKDIGFEATVAEDAPALIWDRSIYRRMIHLWYLTTKSNGSSPNENTFKVGDFNEVYIGHTSTIGDDIHEPVKMGNLINVDQGCGFYGKLTAWEVTSGQFWQSQRSQELYPDHFGRGDFRR